MLVVRFEVGEVGAIPETGVYVGKLSQKVEPAGKGGEAGGRVVFDQIAQYLRR